MTLHAHIANGAIDTVSALPTLYFDGTVWHDWRGTPPWRTAPSAAGWFPVTQTPRPADTDTTTHDESVTVVNGLPVQTWTPRPWTPAEMVARTAAANSATLTNVAALQGRLTRLAAYKADADLVAVLAQANNTALTTQVLNRALKALVRENQRQSATVALLVRLIDPALLADVTDTTDA